MNIPEKAPALQADNVSACKPSILSNFQSQFNNDSEDIHKCRSYCNKRIDEYGIKSRCELILIALDSNSINEMVRVTGKCKRHIKKWLKRFCDLGFNGLYDSPRSGRPSLFDHSFAENVRKISIFTPDSINKIASQKLSNDPISIDQSELANIISDNAKVPMIKGSKWIYSNIGAVFGMSQSTVCRAFKKFKVGNIRPEGSYCFSVDPEYETKLKIVHEILCAYYDYKDTVVLSFDEKPCIQAIEKDIVMTSNMGVSSGCRYHKHGYVNLIAAQCLQTGKVYYELSNEKNREFLKSFFERLIQNNKELQNKQVIVILDNLSTHLFDQEWFDLNPQFKFIFTPTCSSWCNPIESFFSQYSNNCLKHASWTSVEHLINGSREWLDYFNDNMAAPRSWSFDYDAKLQERCNLITNMRTKFLSISKLVKSGVQLIPWAKTYVRQLGVNINKLRYKNKLTRKQLQKLVRGLNNRFGIV